jgi:predicted transcriptional regulator YdeE
MSLIERLAPLFAYPVDPTGPHIVELAEPILIAGMAVDTDVRTVQRDVAALGKRLKAFKAKGHIPNLKQPWAFAAVSRDFDDRTGAFSYIMGDVVTSLDGMPRELTVFEIPPLVYAVFSVRPRNRLGWPVAIAQTKQHAYTAWLPNSRYEPARIIDDFEYHDQRSTRRNKPEIDLYVAVKERPSRHHQAA